MLRQHPRTCGAVMNVIILAAGKGKRFAGDLPKVLVPLCGKPMVQWVLEAVQRAHVTRKPIMVVGVGAWQVKAVVGEAATYVHQAEQRGTGHAVSLCHSASSNAQAVFVVYGDMPLIEPTTIRRIVTTHYAERAVLTMATVTVSDFSEWRQSLATYGRVIRRGGTLERIVEVKDATPEELAVHEVNPSYFCFDTRWLWENVSQLTAGNAQGEYYLTDLLNLAVARREKVASVGIQADEALGANTPQELELIAELVRTRASH